MLRSRSSRRRPPPRVVAVDTKTQALELAASLGADAMVLAGDSGAQEVQRATGGRGADLVLDCVGSDDTLALAAASARTMGDITLIGVVGGTLPFRFGHPANEVSVQSVYWGSRSELVEVLELAARGLLTRAGDGLSARAGHRCLPCLGDRRCAGPGRRRPRGRHVTTRHASLPRPATPGAKIRGHE